MKFESKYNLGQFVVSIVQAHVQLPPEQCSVCDGTGKCELKGAKYDCPKCNGKKTTQARGWGWVVYDCGVIGIIRASTPTDSERENYEESVRDGALFSYMLTAEGSGAVYEESRLWPSRAEAQAECDRRNAT